MTTAYPLAWPQGFPRIKGRIKSQLRSTLPGAIANLQTEMRLFGKDSGKPVEAVLVSSNVTLMDSRPNDPGVACYFIWEGVQCCIAVDRYLKVEENLQAIARIIEAERTKLRHGGLNVVRAAFRGYASLPPPINAAGQLPSPWWAVLGVKESATLAEARAAYLKAVKTEHPDAAPGGGNPARFNLVVEAWKQAQEALA